MLEREGHQLGQLVRLERLLQTGTMLSPRPTRATPAGVNADMRMTGMLGKLDADARGELGAVHLRHDDVAEDQVDRAVPAPDEVQPLRAVAGLEHGVAAVAELAPEHGADALLVVDDEDDAGAGAVGHERLRSGRTGAAAQGTAPAGVR